MSNLPCRTRRPTLKLVPIPGLLAPHITGGVVLPEPPTTAGLLIPRRKAANE